MKNIIRLIYYYLQYTMFNLEQDPLCQKDGHLWCLPLHQKLSLLEMILRTLETCIFIDFHVQQARCSFEIYYCDLLEYNLVRIRIFSIATYSFNDYCISFQNNLCEVIGLSKVSMQSKVVRHSSASAKKMQCLCQS